MRRLVSHRGRKVKVRRGNEWSQELKMHSAMYKRGIPRPRKTEEIYEGITFEVADLVSDSPAKARYRKGGKGSENNWGTRPEEKEN